MLRFLALLLQLLPPAALAPQPSAQDVSLGVVSAGSPGSWDLQRGAEREAGVGHLGEGRFKCPE